MVLRQRPQESEGATAGAARRHGRRQMLLAGRAKVTRTYSSASQQWLAAVGLRVGFVVGLCFWWQRHMSSLHPLFLCAGPRTLRVSSMMYVGQHTGQCTLFCADKAPFCLFRPSSSIQLPALAPVVSITVEKLLCTSGSRLCSLLVACSLASASATTGRDNRPTCCCFCSATRVLRSAQACHHFHRCTTCGALHWLIARLGCVRPSLGPS